jgi:3-hydroxymyristoyl/3-hydroxydecanoyl-(acyl carrier protein) dehydratase
VPGVVILDEMLRAVEVAANAPGATTRWRISAAKFLSPVLPGEELTLAHEPLADGSVRSTASRNGQLVAHALLVPAPSTPVSSQDER